MNQVIFTPLGHDLLKFYADAARGSPDWGKCVSRNAGIC